MSAVMPSRDITRLMEIMRALRDPDTGCPWDIDQDFASIAPYTVEEAYEVADAIARDDMDGLRDELGDLLLQVVYHAQMAAERGAFDFGDVVEAITAKMIRRHPHVFGDAEARARGAVKGMWETIKAQERDRNAGADAAGTLDGVPVALPALTRAVKLQAKAARVGFDWPDAAGVLDKVREETAEVAAELARATADRRAVAAETGDLLFAVANLARHLSVDPESSLREANARFERRFRALEARLAAGGRSAATATPAELEAEWEAVKAQERG